MRELSNDEADSIFVISYPQCGEKYYEVSMDELKTFNHVCTDNPKKETFVTKEFISYLDKFCKYDKIMICIVEDEDRGRWEICEMYLTKFTSTESDEIVEEKLYDLTGMRVDLCDVGAYFESE